MDANRLVQEGLLLVQQGLAMQERSELSSPPERTYSASRMKSPRSARALRGAATPRHHKSPTSSKGIVVTHTMDDFRNAPPLDVGTPLTRRLQRRMSFEQASGIQAPF